MDCNSSEFIGSRYRILNLLRRKRYREGLVRVWPLGRNWTGRDGRRSRAYPGGNDRSTGRTDGRRESACLVVQAWAPRFAVDTPVPGPRRRCRAALRLANSPRVYGLFLNSLVLSAVGKEKEMDSLPGLDLWSPGRPTTLRSIGSPTRIYPVRSTRWSTACGRSTPAAAARSSPRARLSVAVGCAGVSSFGRGAQM